MAGDGQARRREGRMNTPHRRRDGGKRRPFGGLPRLALILAAMLAAAGGVRHTRNPIRTGRSS